MSLESKYSKLKQKYKLLKKAYKDLNQAYNDLSSSSQNDKQLIDSLRSDLQGLDFQSSPLQVPSLSSPVNHSHYSTFSSTEKSIRPPNLTSTFPLIQRSEQAFNSTNVEPIESMSQYFSSSLSLSKYDQLNLLSPNPKRKMFSPKTIRSPSASSGKTPQANPDQSLNIDLSSSFNFQAFLVVGIGNDDKGGIESSPSILFKYLTSNDCISEAMLKIIPDLCFPQGADIRRLKLSGSQSDLNGVLYGQVPYKRNENCIVFTLRAEETLQEYHQDIPNSDQEVVFFVCVKFDDLLTDSDGTEWVVPKFYVISSFIPAFDLHFEMILSLLLIKRLNRTNIIGAGSINVEDLISEECCKEEVLQLDAYSKCEAIASGAELCFGIDTVEHIKYFCPSDLSALDIEWLCVPLLTSLKFNDFFWLILAVLQEKSIVFVSKNLALLSSCVLGILALIRPFKWPYLMVPIVPNSLKEVLDAPVPLVAGAPSLSLQERQALPSIIWVLLDEPLASRRVQGPSHLVQEVAEPEVPQLRSHINELYKSFDTEDFQLLPNSDQRGNCLKIFKLLRAYFQKIIEAFKGVALNENNLREVLIHKFPIYDHKFIRAFSQTLIFINKVQV